jgi:hypothetical protein
MVCGGCEEKKKVAKEAVAKLNVDESDIKRKFDVYWEEKNKLLNIRVVANGEKYEYSDVLLEVRHSHQGDILVVMKVKDGKLVDEANFMNFDYWVKLPKTTKKKGKKIATKIDS